MSAMEAGDPVSGYVDAYYCPDHSHYYHRSCPMCEQEAADTEDIFESDRPVRLLQAAVKEAVLELELDKDPNNIPVFAKLPAPYKREWIAVLSFDPIAVQWTWIPLGPDDNPADGQVELDIDRSARASLVQDLSLALTKGELSPEYAEAAGRVTMHRDDTRATAIVGAKMYSRSYVRRYFAPEQSPPDP